MSSPFSRLEDLFHQLREAGSATRDRLLAELEAEDREMHARVVVMLDAERRLEQDGGDPTFVLLDPDRTLTEAELPTIELSDVEQALASAAASAPVPEIPGFRLLRPLGEGGMGVVWEADQLEPVKRRVAVKLIRSKAQDSAAFLERFKAEQQAQAMMDHPNIARVFDAGALPDGRPYFAMELVAGEPITHYCDSQSVSTDVRLELFRGVCRAVTHAHRRGVVHRDLKPSNILVHEVDGLPTAKVIDFGIAKILEGESFGLELESRVEDVIGTPAYMSPEQIAPSEAGVDTRADVYSLGVVLFELLVGSLPHGAGAGSLAELLALRDRKVSGETPTPSTRLSSVLSDPEQIADRIAERRGTRVEELLRELKGELDWIVLKALAQDVEERYESPAALERDIERFLNDLPVEAGPPHWHYRLRKWVLRHRLQAAAAAFMLLSLGLGVLGLGLGFAEARAGRALAEIRAEEAEASRDFLVGLFELSDDAAARADELSATELVERGAARLATSLERKPRLRATLLRVVAMSFRRLGDYASARDYALRSVAAWTQVAPDGDANGMQRAEAMLEVARAELSAGRLQEAQERLRELIKQSAGAGKDAMSVTAFAEADLAEALRLDGRVEEALEHSRRARLLAEQVFGEIDTRTAWLVGRDGLIQVAAHDATAALSSWRQAIAILSETRGELDPEVAPHLNNLAAVLSRQGRAAESEPLLDRLVQIDRARYGETHALTARSLFLHGESLRAAGRAADAALELTQALSIQRSTLGAHPATALTLHELGLASFDQGRPEAAESLLQESLLIRRRVYGEAHVEVASSWSDLADVLRGLGRLEEARDYGSRAIEIARRVMPEGDRRLGLYLLGLSDSNTRLGDLVKARSELDAARSNFATSLPPEHLFRVLADLQHAELLIAEDDREGAGTALVSIEQRLNEADASPAGKAAVRSRLDAARVLLRAP